MNVLSMNILVVIYSQALHVFTISTIYHAPTGDSPGSRQEATRKRARGSLKGLLSIDLYMKKAFYTSPRFICYLPTTIFFFFFYINIYNI